MKFVDGLAPLLTPGRSTRAVVLGGASCVWQDAEKVVAEFGPLVHPRGCRYIAVNDAGAAWAGPLDAWVTLHPEKMETWRAVRRQSYAKLHGKLGEAGVGNALPMIADDLIQYWCHESHALAKTEGWRSLGELWGGAGSGSSGLFAVRVALHIGCTRVILCGVPMDRGAHFFDGAPWLERDAFWQAWLENAPSLRANVRSMSGQTAELLGHPTRDWLAGNG